MSQSFKFLLNNSDNNENDDDDDSRTLLNGDSLTNATTINYLRDEGILEGSTVYDGNFQEDYAKVQVNHNRSFSNDQHLKTQLSQMHYNNNRISLNRSIMSGLQILNELKDENSTRPIFYPTNDLSNHLLNSKKAHLALIRKNSIKAFSKEIEQDNDQGDNVNDDDDKEDDIDLKILKLNLRQDSNVELPNLDKSAISQLLNGRFIQVSKHLKSLKERIDDTSSKILVTGDLNSGKSTFCNALLRRKVLPEDQQPCTTVFSEVIDYKENNSIEEVHAVPIESTYNIRNESTYKIFGLKDLEILVGECDKYSILKVYVNDKRSMDQSLLRNGIIDIAIIDAPGLNLDSYQTTELFARQEEIDLVIFVLSAENHFTLSGKEFISAANNEKKLMFFVINRFDNIKDKIKCQNRILDQVQTLSPDTHKDSREFVHFVSSSEIVDGLPEDNSSDTDNNNHNDDDDDDDDNNDGFTTPDFDHLEASLRNFILQKRSLSKLQPAKTYLTKLFSDIESLATINSKLYQNEKLDLETKLNAIQPLYEKKLVESVRLNEKIEKLIESTSNELYQFTKNEILSTLDKIGEHPIVQFDGILNVFQFTVETQDAMAEKIINSVKISEDYAKRVTIEQLNRINKLGEQSLGGAFNNKELVFRDDIMFTRRRDTISRNLNHDISIFDYFDPSIDGFLQFCGLKQDLKISKSSLEVWKNSAYSSVGLFAFSKVLSANRVIKSIFHYGSFFSYNTVKYIAIPISIGATLIGIGYLISDIPFALSRNLSKNYKYQIKELDYPHENANRISKESNKILRYPLKRIQNTYQTLLDEEVSKREKLSNSIIASETSLLFFNKLLKKAVDQKNLVESFDLESINQID
ncbi:hypothetical protein WICMUC_000055 [Wickerhamomyces mucosus]|uniref:Dynamin-type G domain-containing protein n=1 Tax=Wickerhamomyces mucosus TaxID=1378264 RepID=A0A9P8PYJ0_9ASCO|nr:hypothetical protein WICMUC_000055 [Wickerhamomyces mucosus]